MSKRSGDGILIPCPFCSGRAEFRNELGQEFREENGVVVWGIYIRCTECSASLGEGGLNSQECCEGLFETFTEATEAWNTRK